MSARITRRHALMAIPAAALASRAVRAAGYPDRTVTMVVPYSPGGGTDIAARLVASALEKVLKQTVVVVNKPGAGSIIGVEYVSHAAPDGYTLLFTAGDGMVMDPAMYKSLPYDTNRDFLPITDVVTFPLFVIVKGDSPIKSIQELVAYVKAHPDKANYASSSSVFWLASELFAQQAGLKATRVQYKGAGNMVSAVMSGEVLFAIPSPPPVVGQAKAGTVRILATTAPHRLPGFPDVPTMAEAGVPGVTVVDWSGMWAPVGTSREIVATLNKAVRQVLAMPEFAEKTARINVTPAGASEADFKTLITSELARWKGVAEKAHISLTR
ncbi:MAG TPA: tripartite tricarboxylate transporter substrate binding protein [Pseudolabrys sp.]|nr:tripartite tricarboxylate transporter substrate binding protein [Pseudolabrys sp.]